MSSVVGAVRVEGLRDLQAALRRLDGESQKALRVALNTAVELIAVDVRRRLPYGTGRAKSTVRPTSSQREASLSAGGRKAPYVPWLDYGGRVGRNRSVSRPFKPEGRYVYPSYHANRDDMLDVLATEITRAAISAGLTVT